MRWQDFWGVWLLASLVLGLLCLSSGAADAEEISESERAELIEIFDQLEKTVNRQADTIGKLRSELETQKKVLTELRNSLTAQKETINNLNHSLVEAERSLRAEREAKAAAMMRARVGFFSVGLGVGAGVFAVADLLID